MEDIFEGGEFLVYRVLFIFLGGGLIVCKFCFVGWMFFKFLCFGWRIVCFLIGLYLVIFDFGVDVFLLDSFFFGREFKLFVELDMRDVFFFFFIIDYSFIIRGVVWFSGWS